MELTLRVLSLGLRVERDLHLQVVLERECLQGFVQGSGRCEDDTIRHHMSVNDSRIEEIRSRWWPEALIDGDEVRVESIRVEHFLLGCSQDSVAELPDAVASDVQTLPFRQQLEGIKTVEIVQRRLGQFRQRMQHFVNNVQELFLSQLVLHDQVRVSPEHHRIVNVNGVVSSLSLPGDVQWRVATHVGRYLSTQSLESGGGSGCKEK